MQILFHAGGIDPAPWIQSFKSTLPQAQLREWREGDDAAADYAVVWKPPAAMLRGRTELKAIFNLGAGVDAILQLGDALPPTVPLVRIDDAGMADQMAEYVTHAALGYYRRLDEHAENIRQRQWRFIMPYERQDFSIGIMGLGVLGSRIASALAQFNFPLRGWSRTAKQLPGVESFAGDAQLADFLKGTRLLICVLPLTPHTQDILNRQTLSALAPESYLINVARGAHLVEEDLLALVQSGHIKGATLDVFRQEPLPADHPFWNEPRIVITPHMSAMTLRADSVRQISNKIAAIERGEAVAGVVDLARQY